MPVEESKSESMTSRLLAEIKSEVASCQMCPLWKTRTHTVPGEGSPTAEIMFIGEGPGKDEDEQGRPFVGRAGKLLDELIASLPMRREDVYIANVVKCRPPGNRDPEREEVGACSDYLNRQIEAIDPLVIVPLGRHALGWFVKNPRITDANGKVTRHGDRVLMPLLHPASALRGNEEYNRRLREGIQKLPEAILEGIRVRREASERKMRSANAKAESDTSAFEASAAASTENDQTEDMSNRESESMVTDAAIGMFERSQTTAEVLTEARMLREKEESEERVENEIAETVMDDRQKALF